MAKPTNSREESSFPFTEFPLGLASDRPEGTGPTSEGTPFGRLPEERQFMFPDFSSLEEAGRTLEAFGAAPVFLREEGGESGGRMNESSGTDASAELVRGIGLAVGYGNWHGFLVEHPMPDRVLNILRLPGSHHREEYPWVSCNDSIALIYFRTDASPNMLRALALLVQDSLDVRIIASVDVTRFGSVSTPLRLDGTPVLPIPPSGELKGGHWKFVGGVPSQPPELRCFKLLTNTGPLTPERRSVVKLNYDIGNQLDYHERQIRRRSYCGNQTGSETSV